MRSTFFGLDIARRALMVQQRAMDVVGHNIANASTGGYSRQEVLFAATNPFAVSTGSGRAGQVGTGVQEAAILRYRDAFLDRQFRQKNAYQGLLQGREEVLTQVERILGEPSDHGIRAGLDAFWESLQVLHSRPGDLDARIQVRERATTLLDAVRDTHRQLQEVRDNVDMALRAKFNDLNSLAARVAGLGEQIAQVQSSGQSPNDLMDQRDLMLDEMARLAGVDAVPQADGHLAVYLGSRPLVFGHLAGSVGALKGPGDPVSRFVWSDGDDVQLSSGELSSLLQARDEILPRYMAHLDTLMRTVAEAFNAYHTEGYDLAGNPGEDFFTITADPMGIFISETIAGGADRIAAALTLPVFSGDGQNAARLAGLRYEKIFATDLTGAQPVSAGEFYRAVVSALGVESQETQRRYQAIELQVHQIEQQRLALSGVSLDEEMIRLIHHQQAYAAAARVVTTLDEAIDVLINRMGLVGR